MFTILKETHIDFMSKRRVFFALSIAATLIGIVSFALHGGFRLGIDFAGGRLIELRLSESMSIDAVRQAAGRAGFPQAEIQRVKGGNEVLFRISDISLAEQQGGAETISERISRAITEVHPGQQVELLREESVGAKIGKEIRGQAFWAIVISLALILLYIAFRFEFRFGLGAIIALAHDILLTLTLFSLLNREITMSVVAALLTLAGYSINDTIVVYDRIREQMVRLRREPFESVLNISVNQTLSRTLLTGLSTLFASGALLLFGGEVIRDFALAMTFGIIVGTYSSVFVASALVLEIRKAAETRAATSA
ncbi:MAG: protein translocase subunit SecF [Candidatus Eisenbacteria bacterium]